MNFIKWMLCSAVFLAMYACTQVDASVAMQKAVDTFHENYNHSLFKANYAELKKHSPMEGRVEDYESAFENVKGRLGAFVQAKHLRTDYTAVTSDQRPLIKLEFDSRYEKGPAREFFYFDKGGNLYRHELYSDLLLPATASKS